MENLPPLKCGAFAYVRNPNNKFKGSGFAESLVLLIKYIAIFITAFTVLISNPFKVNIFFHSFEAGDLIN